MENVQQLLGGNAHVGFVQADALAPELALVAPLYDDVVHVLVRRESEIARLADLRNRRVALGRPGSGMRVSALEVLRAAGLTAGDIQQSEARFEELLLDTTLEGAIAVTRGDHPQLRELLNDGRFRLLGLGAEEIEELALGPFHPRTLKADSYPAAALPSGPLQTVSTTAFLSCSRDAPDALVHALLDAFYAPGGVAEREGLLPIAAAERNRMLPWHPAARRRLLPGGP